MPEISTRLRPLLLLVVACSVAVTSLGGPAAAGSSDRIDQIIKRMTLEEKVGQLFVTYAYGRTADTTDPVDVANNQRDLGVANGKALIEKYHVGGVIYFAWSNNVANPEQIAGLSNGLQRVATSQRSGIPLLISTDQEHGVVARVGPPATQLPGNMALGAGRSAPNTYDAAQISGRELRAIGINQNFAPVADVNVNAQNPVIGVRSFGSDPSLVSDMVSASVDGYQSADVAATAKHFPGHGDTATDSHYGVPIINHSRAEWDSIDAPPFRAAVSRGIDTIMTAHIVVPALDPSEVPATLSKPIITDILRGEMGYDGVVITDALTMQGVRDGFGDDRIPVLALKAGVDQLLMPAPGKLDIAYNAVLDAVRSGELTEDRIDQSVHRVLQLKMTRGLFKPKNVIVDESKVGSLVGHRGAPAAGPGDHRRHRHPGQGRRRRAAAREGRPEGPRDRCQRHPRPRRADLRSRARRVGVQHGHRAQRRDDRDRRGEGPGQRPGRRRDQQGLDERWSAEAGQAAAGHRKAGRRGGRAGPVRHRVHHRCTHLPRDVLHHRHLRRVARPGALRRGRARWPAAGRDPCRR